MTVGRGNRFPRFTVARLMTVAFGTLACLPVILWLAFQHKPGWYRPVALDEGQERAAKADAVAVADYVSDRLVEGRPFEVALRDQAVNAWLAVWPYAYPDSRDLLPPGLTDPAVRFNGDGVRVGVHYKADGWQAIIGVRLVVGLSRDGTKITLALTGASGGSLPLPRTLLDRVIERFLPALRTPLGRRHAGGEPGTRGDPLRAAFQSVRSAADLFQGIAVPNRFVWFNGDRPFRIQSVAFGDGEVRLAIEPL